MGFTKKQILLAALLIVVAGVFVYAIYPRLKLNQESKSAMERANRSRALYSLLAEFHQDYGAFPSDETAKEFKGTIRGGTSSNALFSQLIAGQYMSGADAENLFSCYTFLPEFREADGITTTPDDLLAEGECGFAFVHGLNNKQSNSPLVFAPLDKRGEWISEVKRWIILRVDGSAFAGSIKKKQTPRKLYEKALGSTENPPSFDLRLPLYLE